MKRSPFYNYSIIFIAISAFTILSCNIFLPMPEEDYVEEKYDIKGKDISATANSITTDSTPLLSWSLSNDVKSFDLQICDDDNFNSLIVNVLGLTNSTYQIEKPLTEYGRYAWRVRAVTKSGELSRWYVFHFSYLEAETYDSFEVHDGTFSTLHDWTLGPLDYYQNENKPVLQTEEVSDGEYAVELIDRTYLETTITVDNDCFLTFDIMKTNTYGDFEFYIDDIEYISTDEEYSQWTTQILYLAQGSHTVKWEYANGYSTEDRTFIDKVCIIPLPEFSYAFEEWDDTIGTITSITRSGTTEPYIDPVNAVNGSYSVIFGEKDSTGNSAFQTTVNFHQDSVIRFSYIKSGSGANLYFSIDDSIKLDTTYYTDDWASVSYYVTAGEHMLEWEHEKNFDHGERAWIDNISAIAIPEFSQTTVFEEWDNTIGTVTSLSKSGTTVPYIDSTDTYSGLYSVIFGEEDSYGNSAFRADVDILNDCYINFKYKRSESGADLYFRIDNSIKLDTWSSAPDWVEVSYILTTGTHSIEWEHDKNYDGTERAWIDDITLTTMPNITNAFEDWDSTAGTYTSVVRSGDIFPYMQSSYVNTGTYAVIFGPMNNSEDSQFQAEITVNTASTLSFYYRKSSYCYINLYVDGVSQTVGSFDLYYGSWTHFTKSLAAGTYTVRWEVIASASSTGKTAYIDNITLIPY